jgi:Concanavalin A-like lectin/glucanases superfamily
MRNNGVLLVLCLLLPLWARADVSCDGIDDDFSTQAALSNFLTASTGSLVVVYTPTGTASFQAAPCYGGEFIIADASDGPYAGLYRHGNFGGGDRICAYNWSSGAENPALAATYTVDVRMHLAWVHSGGQLLFYKNGALVSAGVASGATENISHTLRVCGGIAASNDNSLRGHGRIIEVKTYNVALTAAQIAAEGTSAVRNVIPVAATARWNFDTCPIGSSAQGVGFPDRSGNARTITGDAGANTTGADCLGSSIPYQWGVW